MIGFPSREERFSARKSASLGSGQFLGIDLKMQRQMARPKVAAPKRRGFLLPKTNFTKVLHIQFLDMTCHKRHRLVCLVSQLKPRLE
jgi:hypothetical protein